MFFLNFSVILAKISLESTFLAPHFSVRATELDFTFCVPARMVCPRGSGKKKPAKWKLDSLFAPKARIFWDLFVVPLLKKMEPEGLVTEIQKNGSEKTRLP